MPSDSDGQIVRSEWVEPTFYARVPKIAMFELSPYELALYTHYCQIASEKSSCFYTNENLAKRAQMSVATLKRVRNLLVTKGYIAVDHEPDSNGRYGRVIVTVVNLWRKNHERFSAPSSSGAGDDGDSDAPGSHRANKNKELESSVKDSEDSKPPTSGDGATVNQDLFQREERDPETPHKPARRRSEKQQAWDDVQLAVAENWKLSLTDKSGRGLVQRLASALTSDGVRATASQINSFVAWYRTALPGMTLPLDADRLYKHYRDFLSQLEAQTDGIFIPVRQSTSRYIPDPNNPDPKPLTAEQMALFINYRGDDYQGFIRDL